MQRIGSIRGIGALDSSPAHVLERLLRDVREAIRALEHAKRDQRKSLDRVISRMHALNDFPRAIKKNPSELSVLSRDDPWLFCYLVNDVRERSEAARIALERDGKAVTEQKLRKALNERDEQIRQELTAVSIKIGFG